jgi:hypothetical protein
MCVEGLMVMFLPREFFNPVEGPWHMRQSEDCWARAWGRNSRVAKRISRNKKSIRW